MRLRLTETGALLLHTQLRLDGTFQHRLIRKDIALPCAALETAQLTVSQEPKTIQLTLRHRAARHSISIPRTNVRQVAGTAHQWIEDALNGRLEGAA